MHKTANEYVAIEPLQSRVMQNLSCSIVRHACAAKRRFIATGQPGSKETPYLVDEVCVEQFAKDLAPAFNQEAGYPSPAQIEQNFFP